MHSQDPSQPHKPLLRHILLLTHSRHTRGNRVGCPHFPKLKKATYCPSTSQATLAGWPLAGNAAIRDMMHATAAAYWASRCSLHASALCCATTTRGISRCQKSSCPLCHITEGIPQGISHDLVALSVIGTSTGSVLVLVPSASTLISARFTASFGASASAAKLLSVLGIQL